MLAGRCPLAGVSYRAVSFAGGVGVGDAGTGGCDCLGGAALTSYGRNTWRPGWRGFVPLIAA